MFDQTLLASGPSQWFKLPNGATMVDEITPILNVFLSGTYVGVLSTEVRIKTKTGYVTGPSGSPSLASGAVGVDQLNRMNGIEYRYVLVLTSGSVRLVSPDAVLA